VGKGLHRKSELRQREKDEGKEKKRLKFGKTGERRRTMLC